MSLVLLFLTVSITFFPPAGPDEPTAKRSKITTYNYSQSQSNQSTNLKNLLPSNMVAVVVLEPLKSYRTKKVKFTEVDTYYFERKQNWVTVPSEGGSSLGIKLFFNWLLWYLLLLCMLTSCLLLFECLLIGYCCRCYYLLCQTECFVGGHYLLWCCF